MKLEEGRAVRPPLIHEEEVSQSFLNNYFIGQNNNLPQTLTRADTGLSPLEQYADRREFPSLHPGEKWGERRPTETLDTIMVPGGFQKPFDEPDNDQQAELEKQWPEPNASTADGLSDGQAQTRLQRLPQDVRKERSAMSRWYHMALRRSAVKPGPYSGLDFAASLPTEHASSILSRAGSSLDSTRLIYVVEYRHEADILSGSSPRPFKTMASLRQYLKAADTDAILRLIYTCNDEQAVDCLSSDFGISSSSVQYGERNFRDWMQEDRSSRRAAGKAVRWRPALDTARNLICSAFAVDFGRPLVSRVAKSAKTSRARLSESRQRQRAAVYMQRPSTSKIPGARVTRFSTGVRSLPEYAACPTIIISEYSSNGVGRIITERSLLGVGVSGAEKAQAVTKTIEEILSHLFEGIWQLWETQIMLLHEPHAELEDFIWSQPADSSRAREVWSMSQKLHTMLKHINRHASLFEAVQEDFKIFTERNEHQDWLEPLLDEFRQLSETIHVDYVQPLEHMIDLMYKSVTIRDSRQSLELNASLWRLSWITFIFLPLTFLSGFFGMNVSLFAHNPSIRWYFVSAVPLLVLVVAFWFGVRNLAPGSKRMGGGNAAAELEYLRNGTVPSEVDFGGDEGDSNGDARHTLRKSLARFSGGRAT
ncbi:uncharacterized protein HMPREF1541_06588 [Cyphellophora europaea CBS 101466]|uniref:Uncharacterized protein n=1 Tax=Cyphellophora europaea (strain CBS 101466) TaxID=1220924 RepID=W2RQ04_CYPE1|nr:uncharacterized protein HMPREF1541_06588 [Cyphellophora europaea CBS 101466]ETN38552.1 hypothetical protein HMPREF1541_06588 [Cyphellophora europaea CBS 101466]